jgi:hypothetical protein
VKAVREERFRGKRVFGKQSFYMGRRKMRKEKSKAVKQTEEGIARVPVEQARLLIVGCRSEP